MSLLSIAQRLGKYSWFPRMRGVIVPVDRLIVRITNGKVVALGVAPSLTLTTIGRKSGLPRTQPLLYLSYGEQIVLVGSNWGGPHHPAWTANLIANPEATVRINGRDVRATARLVTGEERDHIWRLALRIWPAFDVYAARCAPRQIRVFCLTPSDCEA